MKIFVDANIIVSVLNKEYPLFSDTSRILSLADYGDHEIFTSPVCLAIAFYFAEKKYKTKMARQKISILYDHIKIAEVTKTCVRKALENPSIHDFEDGLEYYAAIESRCSCIVTEDVGDFYYSEIEVLNSYDFFRKHMVRRKA